MYIIVNVNQLRGCILWQYGSLHAMITGENINILQSKQAIKQALSKKDSSEQRNTRPGILYHGIVNYLISPDKRGPGDIPRYKCKRNLCLYRRIAEKIKGGLYNEL